MKGKFWSEEEDATIMKMRKAGASWSAVGAALHREPASCANRWYRVRQGVTTSAAAYWSLDEDDLLREEWRKDEPDVEALAETLDRTPNAIVQRARDLRVVSKLSKREVGDGSNVRRCHDCGKPTHNYRCPACLRRWRQCNGVSLSGCNDEDGV